MAGSPHSAAWAGWWNLDVATSTARPVAMGSTVRNVPSSTPEAMIVASQPDHLVDMGGDDGLGVGRQRPVGGEQLGIIGGPAALDGDQGVDQLPQPLGGRARARATMARSGGMVASTHRPTTISRSSALLATCL